MTIPALVASQFLFVLFLHLLPRSFVLSTNILWSTLLPSAENLEKKWKHSHLLGTQRTILFLSLLVLSSRGNVQPGETGNRTLWLGISAQHLLDGPPKPLVLYSTGCSFKKYCFLLTCPARLPLAVINQEDLS